MEPEFISDDHRTYCLIIPRTCETEETEFFTQSTDYFQVGFIRRKAGELIKRHYHPKTERRIDATWEFLLVRSGAMTITVFDEQNEPVAERRLEEGDAVLFMGGGHGFVAHGELTLLEVKQGPYVGAKDKVHF